MKTLLLSATIVAFTATFVPSAHAANGKTTGLVGGAVAGAVVGGPVGAVVGGVAGYTVGKEVDRDHHRKIIHRHHRDYDNR